MDIFALDLIYFKIAQLLPLKDLLSLTAARKMHQEYYFRALGHKLRCGDQKLLYLIYANTESLTFAQIGYILENVNYDDVADLKIHNNDSGPAYINIESCMYGHDATT